MEATDILNLVSRWMHIISVIVLVGGTLFLRFVVLPVKSSDSFDDTLHESMRRRWSKMVMCSVLFLLISGLYNAAMKEMTYELDMVYRSLVTAKLALGFMVFFFVSVLAGKSNMAKKYRESEAKWYNFTCAAMLALVCIAGCMKMGQYPLKIDEIEEARGLRVDAQEYRTSLSDRDVGARAIGDQIRCQIFRPRYAEDVFHRRRS